MHVRVMASKFSTVKNLHSNQTLQKTSSYCKWFHYYFANRVPVQHSEVFWYTLLVRCLTFFYLVNSCRFTPDFTSSRVIRELKLVTAGGSVFVFVLNASLPYHMLAVCAETLPRPNWELELYIIVSLIMRSDFSYLIIAKKKSKPCLTNFAQAKQCLYTTHNYVFWIWCFELTVHEKKTKESCVKVIFVIDIYYVNCAFVMH